MSHLPTKLTPRHARIVWLLLGAAVIAACTDDPALTEPPSLPAADVVVAAETPNFFVTVHTPGGGVLANATVTVMSQNGEAVPPISRLTDQFGVAPFQVPNGLYCVVARVIPYNATGPTVHFPANLPDIDNPVTLANPGPTAAAATVSGNRGEVSYSPSAFESCYSNPRVRVNGPTTNFAITLQEANAVKLNTGTFSGTGAENILASVIVPTDAPPWASGLSIPEDVKPGFYANGFFSSNGQFDLAVPKGLSLFYIELQKLISTPTGDAWITLTAKQTDYESIAMPVEPLFCEVSVVTDERTPSSGIDLLVYKHAYMASATPTELTLLRDAWGSQLAFTGDGDFTQSIRFRTEGGTISARVNVSSDGVDSCSAGSTSSFVVAFCAKVGDRFYLTTIAPKTPDGLTQIESSISTSSGEKIPATEKTGPGISSAFLVTGYPPDSDGVEPYFCPLERSNDDKWFVF